MNTTKEKQSKLQIIISILALTVIIFAEMYLMINLKESYVVIILLAIAALVAVYVMVNAYMMLDEIKEVKRNENLENLYKSNKASYILLKKRFAEIEERLNALQENSKVSEEIIHAQKGTAKVIINRNKENADAIMNSNNQVLNRLDEVEEAQNKKITDVITQTEIKIQDLVVQLKDAELRLNQAIMNGTKVVMPAPVAYAAVESVAVESVLESEDISMREETPTVEVDPIVEEMSVDAPVVEVDAEPIVENTPVVEEVPPMPDMSDPNKTMSPDDIAALFANLAPTEEPIVETEPEPIVEEKPAMPDMSDPNKTMSPDDIAALFANLAPTEEPVVEAEPEPIVEEKPAMPDLSDPNKAMSSDEIAALFANMAGGDVTEEDDIVIEEIVEEKPPMPDLSDPNKVMSPDEIAALLANL